MASEETVLIPKTEYEQLLSQKSRISLLEHQLAELKRLIFGAKSERFVSVSDMATGNLFEMPEAEPVQKQVEEISYTRNKAEGKKHPLRMELPAHLPRHEEVIEPENLPEGAIKIGEAVTEILDYQPPTLHVRRIIRPKYIISSTDEQTKIIIAALPTLPIPKGNAGAGLLSYILISKFVDHLPFYRQAQMFKRQDVTIAESTINGWFNASCHLLKPLYQVLLEIIVASRYLMADETHISVLTKDKPGATHKGYYWVYYDPVNKLALFDYQKSRGQEGPNGMLEAFDGHLQTDGYVAYTSLKNKDIILLACMAHARRKFEHARDNDRVRAEHALVMFQQLYHIEADIREQRLSPDEIKAIRMERALPVLLEMEAWLKKEIYLVLPKSAIGMAFSYTLNLWPRLMRYIEDGRFLIDNNLIENSIRPVALGRKNYLFAGSHEAAEQAAILYSLLATCKINNIEPFAWLKHTLDVIQDCPADKLKDLLPGTHKTDF
jgi:transposase